jgi:hypothetical protein
MHGIGNVRKNYSLNTWKGSDDSGGYMHSTLDGITVGLCRSGDKYTGTINNGTIYHARLQGTKWAAATLRPLNFASCHKSFYGRINPSNPSGNIMYHLL